MENRPHRIVCLGDSITWAGHWVDLLASLIAVRRPATPVEVLNLGLPSETVSGLSEDGHAGGAFPRPVLRERLGRVLERTRPDSVIACYGMNDGIYLPFDSTRFSAYRKGIDDLERAVVVFIDSIDAAGEIDAFEERHAQGLFGVQERRLGRKVGAGRALHGGGVPGIDDPKGLGAVFLLVLRGCISLADPAAGERFGEFLGGHRGRSAGGVEDLEGAVQAGAERESRARTMEDAP